MKPRVCIFSDQKCIREPLEIYLSSQGYEVYSFTEVQESLLQRISKCKSSQLCVDLVFIDKSITRNSSFSFVEMIKNSPCKIPIENIVIMTGSPQKEDFEVAEGLGCQIVVKPITFAQIDGIMGSCKDKVPDDKRPPPCFSSGMQMQRELPELATTN